MTLRDLYAALELRLGVSIVRREILEGGVSSHVEALLLRTAAGGSFMWCCVNTKAR